ncbi:hydroperoxide isomerase ALOXE3-like [Poeciliopsis prolifica]|uniref:hydroperoxide isomerase ALOXE3-like n=1 Tax=Poeciliopsis prolifica TaxID=188132 RepID=UPI00241409C2|nr:hydroperoxide isomerase ALOXE3-like [Poeciliopsis prolifica]
MAEYKLKVTTGAMRLGGTIDHIYVILIGTEGWSDRTELDNFGIDFRAVKTGTYKVKTISSLGTLLLIKVEKDPFLLFPEDEWYCSKIEVTTPEGEEILFPCYRWISRGEFVELRGGKGLTFMQEEHPLLLKHRKKELAFNKGTYQWALIDDGLMHISHFKDIFELVAELRFSMSELENAREVSLGLAMEILSETGQWKRIEDMKAIFRLKKTKMSEYVSEHWKEDDFFGSQFLNGTNPNVIKRCSKLPPNFPVTDEMVKPFLETGTTLKKEMKEGNIFLCDQKIMDGIPTREKDGNPLYVAAGLCLFYKNPEGKLLPIAIQLYQQPSEQNPIFLPSDLDTDWLLAKLFFRSSDLLQHQTLYHLMHTHYLAEVFAVATFRCLPTIHPLYKLLIPHFRYTLHINILVRKLLLSPEGVLHESSLGEEGLTELMRRDMSQITYSSLCLPENINERGLESIPNFYYRDDALKMWNYIKDFVKAMVKYYYSSDSDVIKDIELQEWINEIFIYGFLANEHSGFPSCFNEIEEVSKFITMVIFTVSVQHSAVNNGQYDYNCWVPNGSLLLHKPPPATKGQSSMQTFLETLPNVDYSVNMSSTVRILSEKHNDVVLLGEFPEEHFDEAVPKKIIKALQANLYYMREEIAARNSQLEIPYTYLTPDVVENSVTI